ncbi:hypothetical protein LINPERPRIM_LOCUS5133 [Linum perenne]
MEAFQGQHHSSLRTILTSHQLCALSPECSTRISMQMIVSEWTSFKINGVLFMTWLL